MVIYPRSLAGLNLNPAKNEQEFQENEIGLLLRRLKYETYLNESGWKILKTFKALGDFDFNEGKKRRFEIKIIVNSTSS